MRTYDLTVSKRPHTPSHLILSLLKRLNQDFSKENLLKLIAFRQFACMENPQANKTVCTDYKV